MILNLVQPFLRARAVPCPVGTVGIIINECEEYLVHVPLLPTSHSSAAKECEQYGFAVRTLPCRHQHRLIQADGLFVNWLALYATAIRVAAATGVGDLRNQLGASNFHSFSSWTKNLIALVWPLRRRS